MNIPEPATGAQKRAAPRVLFARSLGYACLMLIALVSRNAVAQTRVVYIEPGQYGASIALPGDRSTNLRLHSREGHVCGLPLHPSGSGRAFVNSSISQIRESNLSQLESFGSDSPADLVAALKLVFPSLPIHVYDAETKGVRPVALGLGQPSVLNEVHYEGVCLTLEHARVWVFQIRRVVRAHLGLAAPTAAPTVFELPPQTTPPTTLKPPTGIGAPATIR